MGRRYVGGRMGRNESESEDSRCDDDDKNSS